MLVLMSILVPILMILKRCILITRLSLALHVSQVEHTLLILQTVGQRACQEEVDSPAQIV